MGNIKVNRLGTNNRINTEVLPTTYIPSNWVRSLVKITESNKNIKEFKLETTPYLNTEAIKLNGLLLSEGEGNDYTIVDSVLKLNSLIELFPGDLININYQF